jgi:hypothetical protein
VITIAKINSRRQKYVKIAFAYQIGSKSLTVSCLSCPEKKNLKMKKSLKVKYKCRKP